MKPRVYLDVCVLGRLFDDRSEERVRIEAEAAEHLLALHEEQRFLWIGSEVMVDEIMRNPVEAERKEIMALLDRADTCVALTDNDSEAAALFLGFAVKPMDAIHLAVAASNHADVFLTTDDALIRRARRVKPPLAFRIENPSRWVLELLKL